MTRSISGRTDTMPGPLVPIILPSRNTTSRLNSDTTRNGSTAACILVVVLITSPSTCSSLVPLVHSSATLVPPRASDPESRAREPSPPPGPPRLRSQRRWPPSALPSGAPHRLGRARPSPCPERPTSDRGRSPPARSATATPPTAKSQKTHPEQLPHQSTTDATPGYGPSRTARDHQG